MSVWPQAVWIVRKLQKQFDFQAQIKIYTDRLDQLDERINNLSASIENIPINSQVIIGKENNTTGNPDFLTAWEKWTTWLIT